MLNVKKKPSTYGYGEVLRRKGAVLEKDCRN